VGERPASPPMSTAIEAVIDPVPGDNDDWIPLPG
jgi:hypothetical protein